MISQQEFQEKMRGRWALCARGMLGRMTDMHEKGRRRIFVGVRMDGKPWQSFAPHQLHDAESDRLDAVLDMPGVRQTVEDGP